jgi:hypothetical protein
MTHELLENPSKFLQLYVNSLFNLNLVHLTPSQKILAYSDGIVKNLDKMFFSFLLLSAKSYIKIKPSCVLQISGEIDTMHRYLSSLEP